MAVHKAQCRDSDIFLLSPLMQGDANTNASLQALNECLMAREAYVLDQTVASNPELVPALTHLHDLQTALNTICKGNISIPITVQGYTGDLLRELQANLRQVMSHARFITSGDFSHLAGNMGEVSDTFNTMGKALQSAFERLEQQKNDLWELSVHLQREIEARMAVEVNLRHEQLRLQKLASTDSLTGVANRRHFFQLATREIERARRTSMPVSLAMLDIDYFKDVNDSLGHCAGDDVLRTITDIITGIVRPYDLVGRYGGDEFIFLFPETTTKTAYAILERLRGVVERKAICTGKGSQTLTVSIGLTQVELNQEGTASLDEAIIQADNALYTAKKTSRNIIIAA